MTKINMQRQQAKWYEKTFIIPPIRNLILEEVTHGLWLDPFANTASLTSFLGELIESNPPLMVFTNDINPEMPTDHHLDALHFFAQYEDESMDGVFYDPPSSSNETSVLLSSILTPKYKDEIARITKPGGKVISFGSNSNGMGEERGFEICRIVLIAHGDHHNDTICTVEIKKETSKVALTPSPQRLEKELMLTV